MPEDEDPTLTMVKYLFESMKNSVDNCNNKTILNTTENLAINIDRGIIRAGESKNFILQRKLMDISNDMSKLKEIFPTKCECRKME